MRPTSHDRRPDETDETTEGRYELRIWNPSTTTPRAMVDAGRIVGTDSSHDLYLVGPNLKVNAKVRGQVLDVKHMLETSGRLQRWCPAWSAELPLAAEDVARLLEELGLTDNEPVRRVERVEDLASQVAGRPGGIVAAVQKYRRRLDIDGTAAEVTEVTFGDRNERCVAVEGEDPEALHLLTRKFGLDGPNTAMNEHVAETES